MAQVMVAVFLIIILFFAGLLFSCLLKRFVIRILKTLRLEDFLLRVVPSMAKKTAGVKYSFTEITGIIFYWIGLLISLTVILNATGLNIAAELINKIILYIPNAIVAVFILILGTFIASSLGNVVRIVAANAKIDKAEWLGKISRLVVIILASIMALEQLKIDIKILETAIGIMLGSIGLAFAIAVGLGCKEFIKNFIVRIIDRS